MSSTTTSTEHEKGLARLAQRTAGWTEKWFPDAYVFALAGSSSCPLPPCSTAPAR